MLTAWQVFVLWLPWYAACFGMSSWRREALTGSLGFLQGWISLGLLFPSLTKKDTTCAEGRADDSLWGGGSIKAQGGLHSALFPDPLETNTRPEKASLWTEAGSRLSKSGRVLQINHSTEFSQFCKVESVGMEQAVPTSPSMPILVSACLFSHVTMDFSLYHKHFLHPDKTVFRGNFLIKLWHHKIISGGFFLLTSPQLYKAAHAWPKLPGQNFPTAPETKTHSTMEDISKEPTR